MAQKRMFSLSVVDTDKFLEMPVSSRLLYYELGMRADDDGFVDNWKKILMFTGLKEDDMKVLISKQFIIPFESGIIVIRHWRLNNYLQNDRTKPTIHQEELSQLTKDENNVYNLYTDCIHSIDEYSIDKNSIDKNSIYNICETKKENFEDLIEIYNTYCTNLSKVQKITDKRKTAIRKFLKEFTKEDFEEICKIANNSSFLTGDNNNHWKADFDFLLRTDKATSVLEGKYNNLNKSGIYDFKDMWEEAKDDQAGNDTSNNPFSW